MADIAFLWHMHQPDYRHPDSGEFMLPWVFLHSIKDYTDMAAHLERHPGVRCTVNFVPVLLEQIEDYADQFSTGQWRDPLLRIASHPESEALSAVDRDWLLDMAFRCHAPTMLEPFAPYRRLRDVYNCLRLHDGSSLNYLSGHYLSDLATWYLLAWCGESLRRESPVIAEMMAKGDNFSQSDRLQLIAELGAAVAGLIPRYRALSDRGQVELSCTPNTHPLAPLMLDFNCAREAWPECPLPAAPNYPGGRSRVENHLQMAIASHTRRFGQAPAGLWPAEGALSTPFLKQIGEAGFAWTASSHSVLKHSAGIQAKTSTAWQAPEEIPGDLTLFFRNEKLSDLIGFEYAKWHGRDASQHFLNELNTLDHEDHDNLIPIFLDGENAWEYYPFNAWFFFSDLYDALENHPRLQTVTLAEAARKQHGRRQRLHKLTAGSWVFGTLSTWVGNPEKNRAWEMLCDVKLSADRALDSGRLSEAECTEVLRRLSNCESSDWFWWLGDYNSPESVASFDRLFRENLKALYQLLKLPPPASLDQPISKGSGGEPEGGGTMRRAN